MAWWSEILPTNDRIGRKRRGGGSRRRKRKKGIQVTAPKHGRGKQNQKKRGVTVLTARGIVGHYRAGLPKRYSASVDQKDRVIGTRKREGV